MEANEILVVAQHIDTLAPNDGITYPDSNDRSTWSIQFRPEATPEQRAAANSALLNWTPPPPAPHWTSLQFIERFTDVEQLAIVTAAAGVPALRLWYDKAMAADEIVADDPRTVAGVQALVTAGLLTSERATEILGGA